MALIRGLRAWDYDELEHHRCPYCGSECPPRPPVHGPGIREAVASARAVLLDTPHLRTCGMWGEFPGSMGFVHRHIHKKCTCPNLTIYRAIRSFDTIYDRSEEE